MLIYKNRILLFPIYSRNSLSSSLSMSCKMLQGNYMSKSFKKNELYSIKKKVHTILCRRLEFNSQTCKT